MAGECWQIIVPSVAAAKQYLFTHRLPSEGHLTLPSRINEAASNPIGIRCVAMSRRLNTRFYTDPFRRWFAYAVRRKMLVVIRYGLIENRELSFSLWSLIVRRPFWPEKNRTTTSMRKKNNIKINEELHVICLVFLVLFDCATSTASTIAHQRHSFLTTLNRFKFCHRCRRVQAVYPSSQWIYRFLLSPFYSSSIVWRSVF